MRKIILLFLSSIICSLSICQYSPKYFALKDVALIDGISKNVQFNYTVLIHGDRIEAVGPVKEIVIPDSATVIYCAGKFVMPGLIDTHVHLATEPTKEDNRIRAEKDLKDMLLSGVTSVRDMAGDARALASLSRDANLDLIMSPDIYYSALMAGPSFFADPRTHQSTQGGIAGEMPFMRAVTDSTDLHLAIAEAKGTGATGIKLYAALSGELARKITSEAHSQHMIVWSHANLDAASPLEVINAGVNSISHAAMLTNWNSHNIPPACLRPGLDSIFYDSLFHSLPSAEIIKALLANKTMLDATVLVFKDASNDPSLPERRKQVYLTMYEMGKRFTTLAKLAGIPVCTGTDVDEQKFVQREIKVLVHDCGFSPMDALISATRNGAAALGIDKSVGSIQKGKIANLLLLSANPAADINNLDKVALVIKNGKLFNPK